MIETALILVFAVFATVWKSEWRITTSSTGPTSTGNALDLPTTHLIKGICAIIVVLVHVPESYQNPLQDAAGSFAYVAVTFFFFVSAYGMQYSLDHNSDYLRHFWAGRLASLIIPLLFVNIIRFIFHFTTSPNLHTFWSGFFNQYVIVLLEYCVAFYLLNYFERRFGFSQRTTDFILITLVVASSLWIYFTLHNEAFMPWPYERYGLIWGLLAYRNRHAILNWMSEHNTKKLLIITLASLILGVAYLKFKPIFFWGEYLLKVVLGISLITTLFLFATKVRLHNKIGKFLGDISYEIYLAHGIIMSILVYLMPQLTSGQLILLTFIGTISVSWPIARISSRIIKRIKNR